ncbi:MAG: hypothetical protein NVSMB51_02840 [Solirubrobacteraceae bacterium]
MQSLPLIVSFLLALLLAPAAERALAAGPLARTNYRGELLACPLGVVILAAALAALVPLALLHQLAGGVLRPELSWIAVYVLGVAALGLVDDALADQARGWRGHGGAVLRGAWSTGALKAIGSAGLALYVSLGPGTARFLLAAAVLVLATNVFNLLDLRPGRAVKPFALIGFVLLLAPGGLDALWALGLFVGPLLVVGRLDLRERGMLGDTGSNTVGALAGAWLVLTLSTGGLAIAVALLAVVTLYGEFRSISDLIERTPGLRELDWMGRTRDARNA